MKKDLTELVFILDRSGSMSGLETDTIGGYNGLLARQRALPGDVTVTTVLFDDKYELLHDRIDIKGVAPITDKDYYVRGCTALLDAVGRTILKVDNALRHTAEEMRPEHVMFVITTDGYENASREFGLAKVKSLVEARQKAGWEFLFLGANIDAIETAASFGISGDRATNYCPDSQGTAKAYGAIDAAVCAMRMPSAAPRSRSFWKRDVEADHNRRG
ncbi:vWA domain-containing protein [Slackia heliotrinireducens]|uniref:vWA domain-containing protein n=1 Tax=Slackia heliotrinireducens TaxID=84110 RepID=UPI003315E622